MTTSYFLCTSAYTSFNHHTKSKPRPHHSYFVYLLTDPTFLMYNYALIAICVGAWNNHISNQDRKGLIKVKFKIMIAKFPSLILELKPSLNEAVTLTCVKITSLCQVWPGM